MSDKKFDPEVFRSTLKSLAKAVDAFAAEMRSMLASLDDPTVMAALQVAMKAENKSNPWRYFRKDGDNNIRRVRHGEEGIMFRKDGGAEYVEDLDWYLAKTNAFPEITEDEAAAILGGKPWEKSQ